MLAIPYQWCCTPFPFHRQLPTDIQHQELSKGRINRRRMQQRSPTENCFNMVKSILALLCALYYFMCWLFSEIGQGANSTLIVGRKHTRVASHHQELAHYCFFPFWDRLHVLMSWGCIIPLSKLKRRTHNYIARSLWVLPVSKISGKLSDVACAIIIEISSSIHTVRMKRDRVTMTVFKRQRPAAISQIQCWLKASSIQLLINQFINQ